MHQNLFPLVNPFASTETTTSTKTDHLADFQMPFYISRSIQGSIIERTTLSNWTNQQKQKYSIFVCYFRRTFKKNTRETLKWNLFKAMSKFIETRNPRQCRNHHLKLIRAFGEIKNYLAHCVKRIKNLKQKILYTESTLMHIQKQFDLFVQIKERIIDPREMSQNIIVVSDLSQYASHKENPRQFKQDAMKTSDTYPEQQNPVNFNNNYYSILCSRSQTNFSSLSRAKLNKPSLPTFRDNQNQDIEEDFKDKTDNFDPKGYFDTQQGLQSSEQNKAEFENPLILQQSRKQLIYEPNYQFRFGLSAPEQANLLKVKSNGQKTSKYQS